MSATAIVGERAAVVDALVAELRHDAAGRDRAAGVPRDEVAALKRSGLLPLFVPTELGGGGAGWDEVLDVVRRVASADSSAAHILLYHYFGSAAGVALTNGRVGTRRAARIAADNLLAGTVAQAAYPPLVEAVEDPDGGYLLTGEKPFTSGAAAADVLTVWVQFGEGARFDGRDVSGQLATVTVDATAPGVVFGDDWDAVGQRRTVSGRTRLEAVRIAEDDVIHVGYGVEPAVAAGNLDVLYLYSGFAAIFTGIAQGALADALEYTRTRSRPWVESALERVVDDPLLVERYGRLEISVRSAAALTADVARIVEGARARGPELTWDERGAAAVAVSAARVHAAETAVDVSSRVFELTGARSATAEAGLDRFWRNARTLSLHDPLRLKEAEVGAYALDGTLPVPGFYS